MRRKTGAAFLVLLGVTAFAADSPATYTAITDNIPRPEPALPKLGPAGFKFVDPTFGTTILRVSDPNTNPEAIGGGFLTPAGSFEVNWNADTTMFWVWTVGGFMMPFQFDAAAFTATPVRDLKNPSRILTLPFTGTFSFRKPNIMYATSGRKVIEYDFNTQTSTAVFDGNAAVPSASGAAYTPSASDDDTRICLAFGGIQDTHPYAAVLDRNTGRYQVLDTVNSRLNGQPTNKTLGFGIHSAYLDRSGRYVIIAKGSGKISGESEWTVWDVNAGRVYDIGAEWSGHDAAGFGVRVNQSGFYGGTPVFYDEQQWAIRGLGEGEINNYKYLIPWQNLPTPHDPIASGHHSWNNARPDALVPVVGSLVRDARATTVAWRAWDNEIIGIATDGSGKVYRFAHHRSVWDRSDFWDDPHGNISQDGRWYIFTSNWGRTLGSGRRDVFIVKLTADDPPPVQPPADTTGPEVSITAPADGITITGPVKITASATDASGVAGVQFLVNGQAAGAEDTTAPYEFNWSPTDGAYTIAARARDTKGNVSTSAAVAVTVKLPAEPGDTTGPTVAITAPANGATITGPAKITASASDASGVAGVQFLINGQPAGAEDTAAPFEYNWTPQNGSYTLTARARDAKGNVTTSAPVSVAVQIASTHPGKFTPAPRPKKSAPVTYNAITDLMFRRQPAPPALGPAGSVFTDPTFGTNILRVTDAATLPSDPGSSFRTPWGSYEVNWNADTTMFWVHAKPGVIVFRFDAQALKATPVTDSAGRTLVLPGFGPFSFRRPNIIYLGLGLTVVEYDLNTNGSSTVFDAAAAAPDAPEGADTPSVSDDESRIAVAFGGSRGTYRYVAVRDRIADRYHVLDAKDSLIDGAAANQLIGYGIFSAYLDRTGRFVIMAKGQGHTGSDWLVWDVDTGRAYDIEAAWSGRDAAGFGVRVNQSGFEGGYPKFYEEQAWAIRPLEEERINEFSYLLDENRLPFPHQFITVGQHSWNNARPDALVPVIGTITRNTRYNWFPWRLWDNEIIGVPADGSREVYRFAHHYSTYDGTDPDDLPRGNVSQDGRFFAFTSNWAGTLGADPGGGMRHDVFVVALPADPGPPDADPDPTPNDPNDPGAPANPGTPADPGTPSDPGTPEEPPNPGGAANLLTNAGFEQGTLGWAFFDHPRRAIVSIDPHSGANAAAVGISATFYSTVEQIVPVQAGQTYRAATWMRLDGIGGARGAGIVLFWLDAGGRQIGESWISPLTGTFPWRAIEGTAVAPAGASRVKFELWCFTDPDDSGTAWFDDAWFGPAK